MTKGEEEVLRRLGNMLKENDYKLNEENQKELNQFIAMMTEKL